VARARFSQGRDANLMWGSRGNMNCARRNEGDAKNEKPELVNPQRQKCPRTRGDSEREIYPNEYTDRRKTMREHRAPLLLATP